MNIRNRWITGVAVMALSATIGFAAVDGQSAAGHGAGEKDGRAREARMADELGLSPEQQQQWQAAQKQFFETNKTFLQQFRQTMQDFRAAREAGDTAKLQALEPTVKAQREQMKQLRDGQNQKLMSILNDGQKAKFQEMLKQRAEHMHGHRD